MGIRIDGNNDLINAADGSLTVEGLSIDVTGIVTASGGYKVGSAYTVFSNGNVATAGIVSATNLDIAGNTTIASNGRFNIYRPTGTATNTALQINSNVGSTDSTQLIIQAGGSIGIGTDSPSHLLDISGNGVAFPNAAGSTLLRLRDSSGTTTLSIDSAAGSSSVVQFGDTSAASQGTILYNNNSDYFQFNTAGSDKARLDSSGNLGIGTNVFPVNGTNIKVSDGTIARLGLHKTGSNARSMEIGNGGTFLNVYDVTADTQRLRIDDSGNLKLGTATADRDLGGLSVQRLQIEGTDGGSSAIGLINNQNSGGFASLRFAKSRGTSVASNTVVQSGDPLGGIVFCGADGTDMNSVGGEISCFVDSTPGGNDMPGRLVFKTTADGSDAATERFRIGNDGTVTKYYNSSTTQAIFPGTSQVNGVTAIPSQAGTPFVVGRDTGTNRSAHFAGHIKIDSGYGIDFNATADSSATGATMTSEVLEDYEEGTWTPVPTLTYNPSGRSITVGGSNAGVYTKVGRIVHLEFVAHWTAISGSGSYNVGVNGLPFAADATTINNGGSGRSNQTGYLFGLESIQNSQINVLRRYDNGGPNTNDIIHCFAVYTAA